MAPSTVTKPPVVIFKVPDAPFSPTVRSPELDQCDPTPLIVATPVPRSSKDCRPIIPLRFDTNPPLVTFRVPSPKEPTKRSELPVHAESAPSTVTIPVDPVSAPILPLLLLTTPPLVMFIVPWPREPTSMLKEFSHREPTPSTFTVPTESSHTPSSPLALDITPPLEILNVPIPSKAPISAFVEFSQRDPCPDTFTTPVPDEPIRTSIPTSSSPFVTTPPSRTLSSAWPELDPMLIKDVRSNLDPDPLTSTMPVSSRSEMRSELEETTPPFAIFKEPVPPPPTRIDEELSHREPTPSTNTEPVELVNLAIVLVTVESEPPEVIRNTPLVCGCSLTIRSLLDTKPPLLMFKVASPRTAISRLPELIH